MGRPLMIYFDSAYIAKFYLDEPDLFGACAGGGCRRIACCLHGKIEVLTVFHRKLRERAFPPRAFDTLCEQFEADCESSVWEWLPLSATLVGRLSDRIRHLSAVSSSARPMLFI